MLNLSLFATPNVHAVGSWTTGARIPIAVEGYGAAVVGAVHYYFGGYSGGDTSLNQRYSTLTNSWLSNGASLPVPESELSAVTGGGNSCSGGPCLYAVSGRSFPGLLQRYDPVVNNWIFLASMPVPVATEHSVVSTGDKIYVAGGRTSSAPGSGAVNYLQIYDIATDTWSFGPSLPIPVSDAAAIVIDGMIFVFGGFTSNGQIVPTTQIFVISFNRWTIGAPMPTARADESVGDCGSKPHVIGGVVPIGNGFSAAHEVYDPGTNTWSADSPIPGGTSGSGTEVQAISDLSNIYIVGGGIFGSGAGNPTQNIWNCGLAVQLSSTSTTVSCSPSTVAVNQATRCTAFVQDTSATPSSPAGTVTFSSTSSGFFSPSATCTLSAISSSASSCFVNFTPARGTEGIPTIAGNYGGDSTHRPSTGYTTISITQRSTSTAISCSPTTTQNNHPVTCTATVTDTSPGTPITPTGTVAWSSSAQGSFSSASCNLSGTNQSTSSCTVSYTPTPGQPNLQTITGRYSGDTDHSGSLGSTTINVL